MKHIINVLLAISLLSPTIFNDNKMNLNAQEQKNDDNVNSAKPVMKRPSFVPVKYYLYLEPIPRGDISSYDNDKEIFMTQSQHFGQIIVFVNGSPCNMVNFGSQLFSPEGLMVEGKNKIEFKGNLKMPMYVKMIRFEDAPKAYAELFSKKFKVLNKRWLNTQSDVNVLEFEAEEPLETTSKNMAPLDSFDLSEQGRSEIKQEIKDNIKRQLDALRRRNMDDLIKAQSGGIFNKRSDLKADDPLRLSFFAKMIDNPDMTWPDDATIDDLEFIFGEKTVFVYNNKATLEEYGRSSAPYVFQAEHMAKVGDAKIPIMYNYGKCVFTKHFGKINNISGF